MAIVKHTITQADGWVETAADGTDYLLDNHCPNALKLTQQDAPYHTLPAWQGIFGSAPAPPTSAPVETRTWWR